MEHIRGARAHPGGSRGKTVGNAFSDFSEEMAARWGYPAPCMSVHSALMLERNGLTPPDVIADYPGFGLAAIPVGALRRLKRKNGDDCPHGVMWAPEENDPAHCVAFTLDTHQRRKPEREAISAIARWHIALRNEA